MSKNVFTIFKVNKINVNIAVASLRKSISKKEKKERLRYNKDIGVNKIIEREKKQYTKYK